MGPNHLARSALPGPALAASPLASLDFASSRYLHTASSTARVSKASWRRTRAAYGVLASCGSLARSLSIPASMLMPSCAVRKERDPGAADCKARVTHFWCAASSCVVWFHPVCGSVVFRWVSPLHVSWIRASSWMDIVRLHPRRSQHGRGFRFAISHRRRLPMPTMSTSRPTAPFPHRHHQSPIHMSRTEGNRGEGEVWLRLKNGPPRG
eukprot:scaffold1022_cov307-Pavlova_lutheri.AAC.5